MYFRDLSWFTRRMTKSLHRSIIRDDYSATRRKLAFGANPEVPFIGSSALQRAASGGKTNAMRALLEWGVDVNQTTDLCPETPLQRACCALYGVSTVMMLLEAGADPNKRSPNGGSYSSRCSPLSLAAENQDAILIRVLLEAGARIDKSDLSSKEVDLETQTKGILFTYGSVLKQKASNNAVSADCSNSHHEEFESSNRSRGEPRVR
jgi:ankyrin repeat protein